MPTGAFAATEDLGNSGLDDRAGRAAAELAALLDAAPPADRAGSRAAV